MPDATRGQGLLEERVKFPLFFGGHWIDLSEPGRRFTLEFNSVIQLPTFWEVVEGALTEYILEFVKGGWDGIAEGCGL